MERCYSQYGPYKEEGMRGFFKNKRRIFRREKEKITKTKSSQAAEYTYNGRWRFYRSLLFLDRSKPVLSRESNECYQHKDPSGAVSSWGDLQPLRARMSQKSKVASKTSGSTKAPVPAPRKAVQTVATKGRSPSVDKKKASMTQQDSNKAAPSSTRSPSQPPDPKRTRDVSRHRETNRQERHKTTDGPANRAPKAKEAPLSMSLAVLQKSTATGPAGTSKKPSTGSRVDNSTTSRHLSSEKKERNTEKKAVPASSTTSSKEPSSKTGGRARLDAHQKDFKKQSRHEVSAGTSYPRS
ncbi:cytoplasmic dynein 2 intermediate chain 1 [Ixodes scapularis]